MKILVTKPIPQSVSDKFQGEYELVVPEKPLSYDEVYEIIDQFDAYFVMGCKADKALIDKGANLKAIANFGVGYDNIDWKYATEKNIAVINTPQQVTDATAEHTAALIFSTMRGIARFDSQVRKNVWIAPMFPDMNMAISGSTLGILGFGRIGKSVCKKAQGMGMNVIYYDVFRASEEIEKEYNVTYMSFDEVISQSDCISLHMPYIPENHHIINLEIMQKMKPTAYLINAARGPLVDEKDLYEALKNGIIKGAGVDVFETEPHPYEKLYELDNIVLTPHVASGTMKARLGMAVEALTGITEYLGGKIPVNMVNKEIIS